MVGHSGIEGARLCLDRKEPAILNDLLDQFLAGSASPSAEVQSDVRLEDSLAGQKDARKVGTVQSAVKPPRSYLTPVGHS